MRPKLAMTNIFPDPIELKAFAVEQGFDGIDWSFDVETLPGTPAGESKWVEDQSGLMPLEVRYHCPFHRIDLGHDDPVQARAAETVFRKIVRLVSKAGGGYLSLHIGLGHDSTEPLSWERTIRNLRNLVQYGAEQRVRVCLENLAWGWTSKPNLFEKIVRRSGAAVTLDIGHARASRSIKSREYAFEDFITPHADRVLNAHVYHTEVPGLGHVPPERLEDIETRLDRLLEAGCKWWVIEIHEATGLLKTKNMIRAYLARRESYVETAGQDHRAGRVFRM